MYNFLKPSLLICLFLPTLSTANPNVLDYYNEFLPKSDMINHEIFQKNGEFITYAEEFYPENLYKNDTIVDKKNGYIFVNDAGSGAGGSSYQFVLFKNSTGSPYIGIVHHKYDTIAPSLESEIQFFHKDVDIWYPYSSLWNKLTIVDFLPNDFTVKDVKFISSQLGATVSYNLPRKGLIGNAQLNFT